MRTKDRSENVAANRKVLMIKKAGGVLVDGSQKRKLEYKNGCWNIKMKLSRKQNQSQSNIKDGYDATVRVYMETTVEIASIAQAVCMGARP